MWDKDSTRDITYLLPLFSTGNGPFNANIEAQTLAFFYPWYLTNRCSFCQVMFLLLFSNYAQGTNVVLTSPHRIYRISAVYFIPILSQTLLSPTPSNHNGPHFKHYQGWICVGRTWSLPSSSTTRIYGIAIRVSGIGLREAHSIL